MRQRAGSGEARGRAELVLDAQQAVELGDSLGPRGRAALELTDAGGNRKVRDRGVLRLAAAMADHRAPAVTRREVDRRQGLGQRADLIELYQHRVRRAGLDRPSDALGI